MRRRVGMNKAAAAEYRRSNHQSEAKPENRDGENPALTSIIAALLNSAPRTRLAMHRPRGYSSAFTRPIGRRGA